MTSPSRYQVLVVEDDALLAVDLREVLEQAGYDVVGPFRDADLAFDALKATSVDCAVLDINLDGKLVYPLADALAAASIPFVWATGYDEEVLPQRYRGHIFLTKPFASEDVVNAIQDLMAPQSTH